MSLVKLGPHVIEHTAPALAWLKSANIVKVKDSAHLLRLARPDAVTIYRRYFERQDLSRHGADVAREVLRDCQEAQVRPTFIELYNEVGQGEGDRLLQLAAEAMPVARAYGTEVLALSGGTGWWEREDWERWAARDFYGVRYIALHAYWDGPLDGWNSLRHRLAHQWTGGQHPQFVLTEVGRDSLRSGAPAGWRAQGVTADQYRAELEAYDRELQVDPYVLGGVVFTAGAGPGTWANFDADPLGEMPTEPRRLWAVSGGSNTTSDGSGGGSNVPLALAIIPSNQDKNIGVIAGYNEAGGMRYLARAVEREAQKRGATVMVFEPGLESADKTQYASLYVSFGLARTWCDQQLAAGKTPLLLHLHSDAGGGSHSGYVYSDKRPVSLALGKALAERCQRVLGTQRLIGFDYTDWLWDKQAGKHAAAYLEVCAHDVQSDLSALYASVDALAAELVAGALAWAGDVPAAPSEVDTLRRQLAEAQEQLGRYKAAVAAVKTAVAGLA